MAKSIRKSNVPVLFLSARARTPTKSWASTSVADYITKPFTLWSCAPGCAAICALPMFLGGVSQRPTLRVGGIVLDDESKSVTLDGEEVNLTP